MSVITQNGDSALMTAAYGGRTEVARMLVEAGVLLDLQNTVCSYTIIHVLYMMFKNLHALRL